MRHVQDGDPLAIPARTWNEVLDLLERGRGPGPGPASMFLNTVRCLVKNNTGADLPRFGVVGIGDPLILPSDNEAEFLKHMAFSGELAENGDFDLKWGLTVAPIINQEIGVVIVQGLAFCKIDTDGATEAGPADDGDVEALTSSSCGLARVLWRESGSGNKWAIVCLG